MARAQLVESAASIARATPAIEGASPAPAQGSSAKEDQTVPPAVEAVSPALSQPPSEIRDAGAPPPASLPTAAERHWCLRIETIAFVSWSYRLNEWRACFKAGA